MLHKLVPYIYSIFGSISFIIMQIFFKMLSSVIPPTIVTSVQVFFLLLFNSALLIFNDKYQETYAKYYHVSEGSEVEEKQDDSRFEIHIKDAKGTSPLMKSLSSY